MLFVILYSTGWLKQSNARPKSLQFSPTKQQTQEPEMQIYFELFLSLLQISFDYSLFL